MSGRGRKTPRKSTLSPVKTSVEHREPSPLPDAQDVSYNNLIRALEGSPPREKNTRKAPGAPGAPKKPRRGGRRTLKKRFHKNKFRVFLN